MGSTALIDSPAGGNKDWASTTRGDAAKERVMPRKARRKNTTLKERFVEASLALGREADLLKRWKVFFL